MSFREQLRAAVANKPYKRQLTYLRSTGTQYIDTGIKLHGDYTVKVTFGQQLARVDAVARSIFGARNAGKHFFLYQSISVDGVMQSVYGATNINVAYATAGTFSVLEVRKGKVYTDGVLRTSPTEVSFEQDINCWLFRANTDLTTAQTGSICSIARFEIFDGNGKKLIDLIPVLDNSLVACMYDTVSKTFFYNAGTGDFIIPPADDVVTYAASNKLTLYSDSGVLAHGFGGGTGWLLTEQSPLTTFSNWFRGTAVKTIAMPDTVTTLVEYCCYNCTSLTTINIPSGVTSIPDYAFSSDYNLSNITLPDGLLSTGRDSFYNGGITITELPSGMRSIGQRSFGTCLNVAITALPATITSIAQSAFGNCSGITEITIPASVTAIPNGAFSSCSSLATVTINGSGQSISMAFNSCSSLTTVTFTGKPASLYQVFVGCDALADIYVPWADGEVAGYPWGATNATIHYNS